MIEPSTSAFEAHAFDHDASADPKLIHFLQRFYTFSDDRENGDAWAAHFTEDAVMRKAATNVTGRTAIAEVNQGSWKGQAARKHIVHRMFPFSTGETDELMVNGTSKYDFEDGSKGSMAWAARLEIAWSNGAPLIKLYQIFPTTTIKE